MAADRFKRVPTLDLVEAIKRWSGDLGSENDKTLLIILDQFEEYFLYHPAEQGEHTFTRQFPRLLNQDNLPVNVLISIREDALATLDRFKGQIPDLFGNYLRIENLSEEAAEDAILKPLDTFNALDPHRAITMNKPLTQSVVNKIIEMQGTGRRLVQAPYLQLVMRRWWERETEVGSRQFRERTLVADLGGVKSVVDSHLKTTIDGLIPNDQRIVARVFERLSTPTGRKIAQTVSELAGSTRVDPLDIERILEKLRAARVLIPVAPPKGALLDEKCFEFAHDVLARVAAEWLSQYRQAEEVAAAQREAAEANVRTEEMRRMAETARKAERTAVARERIAFSLMTAETNPETSVLLAIQAVLATRDAGYGTLPEAEQMLHKALLRLPVSFVIPEGEGSFDVVSWSPDGAYLAASREQSIKVWRWNPYYVLPELLHHRKVLAICWSPDAKRLATATGDGHVAVWNVESTAELLSFQGHNGAVLAVAWSPDGSRIATASVDSTVKIWEAKSGRLLLTFKSDQGEFRSVSWSPDGKQLAAAGESYFVPVWDAASGSEFMKLFVEGRQNAVAWSPDGSQLATFGSLIDLWNAENGRKLLTLPASGGDLVGAWGPVGKYLATAGDGHSVRIWEAARGLEWLRLAGPVGTSSSISWNPDGKQLACAAPSIRVCEVAPGRELPTLTHGEPVVSASWSPREELIVTVGPKLAKLWDAKTGQVIRTFTGHKQGITDIAWNTDGKYVVTSSYDGTAIVWEVASGREVHTFVSSGKIIAMASSPIEDLLATLADNGTATIWDLPNGTKVREISDPKARFSSMTWSPDGKWLVTTAWNDKIRLWLPGSGQEAESMIRPLTGAAIIRWSPDGTLLALTFSSTIQSAHAEIWDIEKTQKRFSIFGNEEKIKDIAWSPDSSRLAAARAAKVTLWEAYSGCEIFTLEGNANIVTSIAWSADGKKLASADKSGTVRLYAIDIDLLLNLANQRAARNLTIEERQKYLHLD
jgi:WD40 repeat protein